jgi:hypothetical protein
LALALELAANLALASASAASPPKTGKLANSWRSESLVVRQRVVLVVAERQGIVAVFGPHAAVFAHHLFHGHGHVTVIPQVDRADRCHVIQMFSKNLLFPPRRVS